MALIDYANKVIYWDEVNWTWLPHVTLRESKNYFLVLRGVGSFPVKCAEDVTKLLIREGYCLSPLQDLGVSEVSRGTFIFSGLIYTLNNKPSLSTLISKISGLSNSWINRKISHKGVIPRSLFNELTQCTTKLEYKGKVYSGYGELALELGISPSYMYKNLAKGKTIEEILEKHTQRYITDHLGNQFISQKDMLNQWGIPLYTYRSRILLGWSLKKTLSTPSKKIREVQEYKDFKGKVFPSASSLVKEYGISLGTLFRYLDKGGTPEELTYSLFQKSKEGSKFKDHLGNGFPTRAEMLGFYGVKPATFSQRLRLGWSLGEALTGKRKKKIKSNK